jgi:FSR family fosmidomycin resistance protein-like MFS transporter
MERETRRVLIGESVGHAVHDAWFGLAPVLMAALSAQLKMSNSDIALAILLYQLASSVTQPIFGRLSERFGGRPFAVGAILWTTAMFTITLFTHSKLVLMGSIALAGFGSGAWHPQGTVNATLAGGRRWGATSSSVFFFGGMLGASLIGSALGGFLIEAFGRQSLVAISALTVTLCLTVVRSMVPRRLIAEDDEHVRQQTAVSGSADRAFWFMVALLLVGIALRSLAQFSLNTFVPKYQQDLGASPAMYGALMSLFLFGNAIGGVMGSYLADHVGIQRVLPASLVLGGLCFYLFLHGQGLPSYVAFALGGMFLGPSHTLFLVSGQRRFPDRMATVSGLLLGFIFVSGSGGAWVLGLLADRVGLASVLAVVPWAMLGAALAAFVAVPRRAPEVVARQSEAAQA